MQGKYFYTAAVSFCFILLLNISSALDGRWTGIVTTPDGNNLDVVYNFQTDGDNLTGTAESPVGVVSIDHGKVSGNNFSFDVTVQGSVYPHKGILYTDSCGLDIDFGSTIVHTTIVRDSINKQNNFFRLFNKQ